MNSAPAIPAVLKGLREATPVDHNVLSLYLDTSPRRIPRQAYLLAYRDLCKEIRPQLTAAETEHFNEAAARVENLLVGEAGEWPAGLAVFAAGPAHEVHAVALPRRPADALSWDSRYHLEPLQAILDDQERVAIVLFAADKSRLFTFFLGELEEHAVVDDYVPRKQKSGGWAALGQSHFARRRGDHLMRHAAHTITALNAMLRAHPVDRLFVGGPEESRAVLIQQLPKPLRSRLAGTLNIGVSASKAELCQAARQAIETCERQVELAAIEELFDAATTPRVVVGASETLAAVSENRVYRLFIADTYAQVGGECPVCGCLVAGPGPCLACGEPTEPIDDLGDRVVQRALAEGACVDVVSGDAAALLQTRGGLGAWTRY